MTLTPLDAENLRLPVVMRGYDRREVDDFRFRVSVALEEYINQIGALKARIGELEAALARYRESEDLLKNSLVLAQRHADELAAAAHQRADAIIGEAHAEAGAIRQQLAGLKAEREQFEYAFYGLLYGFLKRLEQANPALRQASGAAADTPPETTFSDLRQAPGDLVPPAQTAPGYTGQAASKAPLLSEMLPGSLPAAPVRSTRISPRDADAGSFTAAVSRAGVESEHNLVEERLPLDRAAGPPPEGEPPDEPAPPDTGVPPA